MDEITAREKACYILGLIEVFAHQLSQEIDAPLPDCRNLLRGQVIKYLETGHRNTSFEDLIMHGIISS